MENRKKSFDIIVGAGTCRTMTARFAAKIGLDGCLIDRKDKSKIYDKIYVDAVGSEIFKILIKIT